MQLVRIRLHPCVLVAVLALALLNSCRHAPDETQLRDTISAASAAVEAGDASAAVAPLSDDFDGNAGALDRHSLGNLVRLLHLRGEKIGVMVGPVSIEHRGERMIASFSVSLTSTSNLLPDQVGVYQVESAWRKDGSSWHCFSASWTRSM